MTSTKWTAELIPEIWSLQMIMGRKKNLAIDASMKPRMRSTVRFLLRSLSWLEYEVKSRMMVKNERFAKM